MSRPSVDRAISVLDATADKRGRRNYRVAAAALGCSVEELRSIVPDRRGRPPLDEATLVDDATRILAAYEEAGSIAGAARLLAERGTPIPETTIRRRLDALRKSPARRKRS